MRQKIHDIIATSNKLGFPDVFLTMTCNPYGREITESLEPGETSKDRPELFNGVFHTKRRELLNQIVKEHVFSRVLAHVCVNEFKKRGLVSS